MSRNTFPIGAKIVLWVGLLTIAGLIVIPNLLAAKISWNDWGAIRGLRQLAECQEVFRSHALVDLDGDGKGEFGTFGELSGADGVRRDPEARSRGATVDPSLTSISLAPVDVGGLASRSGYLFRILLPGKDGHPVVEGRASRGSGGSCPRHGPCPGPPDRPSCPTCVTPPPRIREEGTPFSGPVDTDGAERSWCVYAWPVTEYTALKGEARDHNRVFFVDASGDLWQTWNHDHRYFGSAHAPSWDAAMPEDGWGVAWAFAAKGVEEYRGRDGNLWKRVN